MIIKENIVYVSIYDSCVSCGADTNELKTTHIDNRKYYVECAGQLCRECWELVYKIEDK